MDAIFPAEQVNEQKKTLTVTVLKLAVFALVMILNEVVSVYLFFGTAVSLGARELDENSLYLLQWILNDLSSYLFPAVALLLIFRRELSEKTACVSFDGYGTLLEPVLIFPTMIFCGSLASLATTAVAAVMDTLFGTGEIADAMEAAAPETNTNYGVFLLFVCVLGPICEELIFRKLLLVPLRKCGDGFAVVVTALIFGIFHGNFDQCPYAWVVGFFFGLLAVRSNSVIPSMLLHILNNTIVSLSDYLVPVFGEDNVLAVRASETLDGFYVILFFAGIATLGAMISGRTFRMYNYLYTAKSMEKLKMILKMPAVYIGAFLLCLMFLV